MNGIRGSVNQIFKILLDKFSPFFAKGRKSVEKMTHQKKNRDHRTSKIVKSAQSYSNGHLSYYFSARARCMTWRVIFVRSKDEQKQLARTSLNVFQNAYMLYLNQSQNDVVAGHLRLKFW